MGLEFDGVNSIIKNTTSDGDVTIKGNDGGSEISLLTFDVSAEGVATFNKDIKIGDSGKAIFGAGSDLLIYHDGSHSYIQDEGTGDLKITSNGNAISFQKGTSETMAFFDTDAGCELYHDNVARFVTDSAGANVTGTLDVSSRVVVAGGTEATTTSDGSIATAGGLSVTKDTVMGDDLKMLSDGSVIHFGADSEITLTHVHNTGLVINSGAGSNTLQIQSTDGGNSAGPILNFYRNSASPADGDILGKLNFTGNDAGGSTHSYGTIEMECNGVVNGQEQGKFIFKVSMPDGALANTLRLDRVEAVFNEDSEDLDFRVESNNQTHMFFIDGGAEFVSTGDTAPDVSRLGLCLNQAGNDGNILSLKNSDVAHGITDEAETDTFGVFKKQNATLGGLQIIGFSEDDPGVIVQANNASETTAKSNVADGGIILRSSLKSGTAIGGHGTNGNLVVVGNHSVIRFILDAEGDFHADSSSTTFDAYDDAQLVRAYDLSHGRGVINSKFDEYVKYKHEDLADAGLVGREDDGTPNHFINVTGFQRLHNGAIWQQYEKHQKLASAFYKLATKTIGKEEADKLLTEEEIKLLN